MRHEPQHYCCPKKLSDVPPLLANQSNHTLPQNIANPHDKLIKQVLGEPENAASFLAANLPAELVTHLDLDTITVAQTSFIDAQFTQSEADLLTLRSAVGGPLDCFVGIRCHYRIRLKIRC